MSDRQSTMARMPPASGRHGPGRPAKTSAQDIVDAAESIGLRALTRAEVAQRLGVSEATVRHHIGTSQRLYSRTAAQIFERLDCTVDSQDWRDYLRTIASRFAELVQAHPGVEDYVLRGPYEASTLDRFERIMTELLARDPRQDRRVAHLLGSRILNLATMLAPAVGRDDGSPSQVQVYEWTIDAFLIGADALIDEGRVPEVIPTPDAPWAQVGDVE